MIRKILAIGAHPDDVELGCSGMIMRTSLGRIITLTCGESAAASNDDQTRKILAGVRAEEAGNGAQTLGATFQSYFLEDTKIGILDAVAIIEKEIEEYQPDTILTMAKHDTHQDHRAVHEATIIACRDKPCTLLCYMTPSSARNFHATWFIPMTEEEMSIKLNAISCHSSQLHRLYLSPGYVTGMGRYWAMVTRTTYPYVEPYQLIQCWEK